PANLGRVSAFHSQKQTKSELGCPSSGGTGVEPSSGGTGVEPSSGGTGVEPSSGGTGVEPSSGGTGVEPSSGSFKIKQEVQHEFVHQTEIHRKQLFQSER
uniref:Uncharacterized protein n=1 Tax=Oryzias latipes TaxID=8090 RepID=A0A3P9HYB6_ORYLA